MTDGTLVPDGDGWRAFIQRRDPDPGGGLRGLSRIATARLNRQFQPAGPWEILQHEATPTTPRQFWRCPRAEAVPDDGFRLLVSVQERDWPESPDSWHSAWHQEEWQLSVAGRLQQVRHPVHAWNGISPANNPADEIGWLPWTCQNRPMFCRPLRSSLEIFDLSEAHPTASSWHVDLAGRALPAAITSVSPPVVWPGGDRLVLAATGTALMLLRFSAGLPPELKQVTPLPPELPTSVSAERSLDGCDPSGAWTAGGLVQTPHGLVGLVVQPGGQPVLLHLVERRP